METQTPHNYSRAQLADIFSAMPREDQKWSITYLINIAFDEPKPVEKPRQKIKIKRADIEAARRLMSFGEGCNVPADLDVRGIMADTYANSHTRGE